MKILRILGKILLLILLLALVVLAVVLLFLFFCPSVGQVPDREAQNAPESDHFSGGKFRNVNDTRTMTGSAYPASDRRRPKTTLPARTPSFLTDAQEGDLSFTWLGHSSFLLQVGKRTILIDPVLSERSSPVGFIGPGRFSELPLAADELPEIDMLFLSHDHYDHLDYRTILAIQDRVASIVVPLGIDSILESWGIDMQKIHPLDWWESVEIGGVTYTLTPSQHFSGRNPLKGNRTLWGGLYLEDGSHRVYYTGDGGYYEVFADVREWLGAPELMFAECGQYDTAWAKVHMFPEQTVQAGLDAQAGYLVPVHWGSFCICNHAWDDSITRVTAAAEAAGLPVVTPRIGQTVTLSDLAACTERWWESCE